MWDNTKCLPAGMPNSILQVMLLWRIKRWVLPAAIGAKMGMPNRKWLQLSVMVDSK
jgi:hypothetical protein